MCRKNDDRMNLLEQAFFLLFETGAAEFVFYLLNSIPNIKQFVYILDERGWLPVFRVLHLFQHTCYESAKTRRNKLVA